MGKVNDDFYKAVLRGIGAPDDSDANLQLCHAWQRAEGGEAEWNPFNTTMHADGATLYRHNKAGVKNYPDRETGIRATVDTLLLHHYTDIVLALRDSDAMAAAEAIEKSPWGTHGVVDVLRGMGGGGADEGGAAGKGGGSSSGGGGRPAAGLEVPVLRKGAKGPVVGALQVLLTMHGCEPKNSRRKSGHVDEQLGDETEKAIRAYQRKAGIKVDGLAGPETFKRLLGLGSK